MAIAVRMTFAGASVADYERTHELVVAEGAPVGLLLHTAGPVATGWQVIDVWESTAAFEAFQTNVLGPRLAAAGLTTRPHVVMGELANVWAPGTATLASIGADARMPVSA
jgi:hypothetical protein